MITLYQFKNMKKITRLLFMNSLVVWFITAIYLSINSMVNLFTTTDPYYAKIILAISFVTCAISGAFNGRLMGDITGDRQLKTLGNNFDVKFKKPKTGCSTCKGKK